MKTRKIIYADEGMVLTNGEVYGKIIYLADGESIYDYNEISEEEYNRIMKEREKNENNAS